MKRCIILIAVSFILCGMVHAESKDSRKENPHEIRIGITDDFILRSLEAPVGGFYHPDANDGYYISGYHEHSYGSTGHLFAEYQYRFNHWLGVGGVADVRGGFWKETVYSECPIENNTYIRNMYSVRVSLLPTVRFTYFNSEFVSLYASIGAGVHLHSIKTNLVEIFPAVDICYFGLDIGKGHWFCDLELGVSPIPYLLDRMLRLGVGYRF